MSSFTKTSLIEIFKDYVKIISLDRYSTNYIEYLSLITELSSSIGKTIRTVNYMDSDLVPLRGDIVKIPPLFRKRYSEGNNILLANNNFYLLPMSTNKIISDGININEWMRYFFNIQSIDDGLYKCDKNIYLSAIYGIHPMTDKITLTKDDDNITLVCKYSFSINLDHEDNMIIDDITFSQKTFVDDYQYLRSAFGLYIVVSHNTLRKVNIELIRIAFNFPSLSGIIVDTGLDIINKKRYMFKNKTPYEIYTGRLSEFISYDDKHSIRMTKSIDRISKVLDGIKND